jgi:type IV pilus assembly protein PilY1
MSLTLTPMVKGDDMMSGKLLKHCILAIAALLVVAGPMASRAQSNVSEDFTHATTTNSWNFFNGACLTAGTGSSAGTNPGTIPSCLSVTSSYYKENLVGGSAGYLGSSTAPASLTAGVADPDGKGALRFTNGYPGGYHQNGAIVSAGTPFPTGAGVQVTFKTVTYKGDSKGAAGDGADGISFYLMDGSKPAGIGAWGGSLGYSCSNSNPPYDGLVGGYIGLGIDEYGNFLNGTNNTLGETGTSATGDNTASGGGYQPGRIGLRGAGSISWAALTGAYGTNLGASSPYYPASLATTCSNGGVYSTTTNSCGVACSSGSYNASTNTCDSCPAGTTFYSGTNTCNSCASGTYDVNTNSCTPVAYTCPNGATYVASSNSCTPQCSAGSFNSGTSMCNVCASSSTFDYPGHAPSKSTPCASCSKSGSYNATNGSCSTGSLSWAGPKSTSAANTPTVITPKSVSITSSTPSSGVPLSRLAVQKTCKTGHLWNYSTASSPADAGEATLANTANTAGILDYPAIPGAYSVLTNTTIANESAVTRSDATVIAYKLKITQDGLLSFSYSYNGGAYQSVIAKQDITASNGPLPGSFQFGFAGSTGGSTNVHEILCFQATPSDQAATSIGLNAKQAAKIASGTQAYLAYYYPSNWTGRLTANDLLFDASTKILSVSNTANWDASCVLTGVQSAATCPTTGAAGPVTAQASRTILSWDGTQGIPFQWTNLSAAQKTALNSGDASATNLNRLNYLRGDRSKEVNSAGVGLFRPRDSVLADIVDSSPTWVGPPNSPYATTWSDALYSTAAAAENTGTQSYAQFKSTAGTRQNVVYVGANDGLLHGFRAGSYDSNNNYVNNSTTPNDGAEILAYMPGAAISGTVFTSGSTSTSVTDTIHGTDPTNSNAVTSLLDYSNTQYGHNFYVDATPGTGDLFYGGTWHTWAVGGLGAGGAAIYALDVTDPSAFSEGNASTLVIGEWTPASITCANVSGCGKNLGDTYGQPVIRRLHNGMWAVIFGNGFNSRSGDAGIYVMTVDPSTGAKTFYYLSVSNSTTTYTNDGIAYVYPADLDGDRIVDYVYAGDLQGNLWRFDLTSNTASSWAAAASPLFTTDTGQPITTKPAVWIVTPTTGSTLRLMVDFGTGRKIPITNSAPTQYMSGTQSLYGIWDWDMDSWNVKSSTKYYSLTAPQTIGSNLVQQTVMTQSSGELDGSSNQVCWAGTTTCGSGNTQFGWTLDLPGAYEQVIYNPIAYKGAFVVNTLIPTSPSITSCSNSTETGNTIAISVTTGGAITDLFPGYKDAIGFRTDGSGSVTSLNAGGADYWLTQSSDGPGQKPANVCNPPWVWSNGACTILPKLPGPVGKRLTWIKKR